MFDEKEVEMALIRMLLIVFMVAMLSGCSLTENVRPQSLSLLKYGDSQKETIEIIKEAIPLFKFYSKNKVYYAASFKPDGTYQGYVLLFENNQLTSIISAEKGMKIWEEIYGEYWISVPSIDKFDEITSRIIAEKLDLSEIDFSEVNKKNRTKFREGVTEAVAANVFMPFGLIAVVVTGPILIPYVMHELNETEKREKSFLRKVESVPLNSSSSLVKAALGKVENKYKTNGQEILMFHEGVKYKNHLPVSNVSMGFVNDELQWIGYYFHAGKHLKNLERSKKYQSRNSSLN
jgi:hypothetical protein